MMDVLAWRSSADSAHAASVRRALDLRVLDQADVVNPLVDHIQGKVRIRSADGHALAETALDLQGVGGLVVARRIVGEFGAAERQDEFSLADTAGFIGALRPK